MNFSYLTFILVFGFLLVTLIYFQRRKIGIKSNYPLPFFWLKLKKVGAHVYPIIYIVIIVYVFNYRHSVYQLNREFDLSRYSWALKNVIDGGNVLFDDNYQVGFYKEQLSLPSKMDWLNLSYRIEPNNRIRLFNRTGNSEIFKFLIDENPLTYDYFTKSDFLTIKHQNFTMVFEKI